MKRTITRLIGLALLVGCTHDEHDLTGVSQVIAADLIAVCTVTAIDGELASPDPVMFSGSATAFAGGEADGEWTHRVLVGTMTCEEDEDCLGKGRKRGHVIGNGLGHETGKGSGHCEREGSTCTEVPVYDEFIGTVETGGCTINGHKEGILFGSGTWNGALVTFRLVAGDDIVNGDFYGLTVSDGSGVVYSVPETRNLGGDIVVNGF